MFRCVLNALNRGLDGVIREDVLVWVAVYVGILEYIFAAARLIVCVVQRIIVSFLAVGRAILWRHEIGLERHTWTRRPLESTAKHTVIGRSIESYAYIFKVVNPFVVDSPIVQSCG